MSTQTEDTNARIYPCKDCGKMRSKAEGGTTFTVCDACWDKYFKPSQTEDLEARAREWLLGEHGGLWKEQVDGVVRTTNGQSSILKLCAAFARSLAQPSAPTVDQIMDVVRKESGITDDRLEDGEDHGAALVKMECAIEAQLTKLLNP